MLGPRLALLSRLGGEEFIVILVIVMACVLILPGAAA
jgi:hypothetical protein